MLEFKLWLENEFEVPDENQMNRIRKIPIRCDLVPDLHGDRYRCRMPMGEIHEFLIRGGSIIGLQAARGSLNSKLMSLLGNRNFAELYRTLSYVRFNNNPKIRSQVVFKELLPARN